MATKLSFVDRIKASFRFFHDDKNIVLNKSLSHEIEILPSSTAARKWETNFAIAHAMKPRNQVGSLLISSQPNQFWSVNKKSGEYSVQTPSNLG
jgi:hypothetical protein